jgi:hypothetical protein
LKAELRLCLDSVLWLMSDEVAGELRED